MIVSEYLLKIIEDYSFTIYSLLYSCTNAYVICIWYYATVWAPFFRQINSVIVIFIFWKDVWLKVGKSFNFVCKIIFLREYHVVKNEVENNEFLDNGAQTMAICTSAYINWYHSSIYAPTMDHGRLTRHCDDKVDNGDSRDELIQIHQWLKLVAQMVGILVILLNRWSRWSLWWWKRHFVVGQD